MVITFIYYSSSMAVNSFPNQEQYYFYNFYHYYHFSFPAHDLPSLYSIFCRSSPWMIAILRFRKSWQRHHDDRTRDLMRMIVTGRVPEYI